MTLAYDAATNYGTSNVGSFTHTPVGTPRAVVVCIHNANGVDNITGATYGGVAMSRVEWAKTSSGAQTTVYIYFLGSGIPTGPQTVTTTGTPNAQGGHISALTFTGAQNTEIIDSYTSGMGASATNGVTYDEVMSHGGRSSVNVVAFAIPSASLLAGQTNVYDFNSFSNSHGWFLRQTTPSSSDFTAGFVAGTSNQYSMVIATVTEVIPPTILRSFSVMT